MKTGPDYIQFYPTLRCNRNCDFCFNRSMPMKQDMPEHDCLRMLDVLKQASVRTIDIIGGEPTLHRGIVPMVSEALRLGFSVNLSSNGSNLTVLKQMDRPGEKISIGISVNDRDTLEQVREHIRTSAPLVKSVYSAKMDVDLIQDILALGPKRYYLIYRDAMEPNELRDAVAFPSFLQFVDRHFAAERVGTVYCSGFLPDRTNYPELGATRCPAGTTKLGIMPDGSVYPCNLFFGRKEFLLGNIFTDPWNNIWNHERLDFFRAYTSNPCQQRFCEHHAACHGGCPAHGLLLVSDLAAPDPRCAL